MAKQRFPKREEINNAPLSPQGRFQAQLESLLNRQKYRQALEEINKVRRSQPEITFTPSEAEIWLLRGKHEFQKTDFRQADTSLRRALQLGLVGEVHYWLAKCLLEMDRLEAAIDLLREAFDNKNLPKEYSICYPKLLLLKGDTTAVEELLQKQSKRFTTAQLHWLGGILALKAQQPQAALEAFQKVKTPTGESDRPDIWIIYAHQCLENWEAAAKKLGLEEQKSPFGRFSLIEPTYTNHPSLKRLAFFQQAKTGQPSLEYIKTDSSGLSKEVWHALGAIQMIDQENFHDAGHFILKSDRRSTKFPELAKLRPVVLTLAGDQAFQQGELDCASKFWQPLLTEQPFNPQLAVNLLEVLDDNEEYQEYQRLLTRLIKWLEQDGKQNSQNWTKEKLNLTLASAHCYLADNWIALSRVRAALGAVQTAERICPQSPEVLGRRGLIAAVEDRCEEATELLTKAIEGGCRKREVYTRLIETWKELGDQQSAKEARRRFGKYFGDQSSELEVEALPWVDALSTQKYSFFRRLVQTGSETDPALRACRIFVDLVKGEPNSGGKVSLNQPKSSEQWDALLESLSPQDQLPTLQAIALAIEIFAKREKGIAALLTKYMLKLFDLGVQQPQAREAHLVILALKEKDTKKIQFPLRAYLDTMPQPGNALAQIQLKFRRFSDNILQKRILSSFIDDALQKEPQNPLLLLAKATTYPIHHPDYEKFKEQGFDLARRLQDAKALQAFREEQSFVTKRETQSILPDPERFESFDMDDIDDFLETLIRKIVGNKVPPDELQRMLPELKERMLEDMPDFDDEDDEDEDDFDFGFSFRGFAPPSGKSKKRRR